jgi:hypothetical protein
MADIQRCLALRQALLREPERVCAGEEDAPVFLIAIGQVQRSLGSREQCELRALRVESPNATVQGGRDSLQEPELRTRAAPRETTKRVNVVHLVRQQHAGSLLRPVRDPELSAPISIGDECDAAAPLDQVFEEVGVLSISDVQERHRPLARADVERSPPRPGAREEEEQLPPGTKRAGVRADRPRIDVHDELGRGRGPEAAPELGAVLGLVDLEVAPAADLRELVPGAGGSIGVDRRVPAIGRRVQDVRKQLGLLGLGQAREGEKGEDDTGKLQHGRS